MREREQQSGAMNSNEPGSHRITSLQANLGFGFHWNHQLPLKVGSLEKILLDYPFPN